MPGVAEACIGGPQVEEHRKQDSDEQAELAAKS